MHEHTSITELALGAPSLPSDIEVLAELRQSKLPLVLWGAAKCAQNFCRLLARNDIPVTAVFVDIRLAGMKLNGLDISSFDDVCSAYRKFNILVAHGRPELAGKYRGHPQVANVYILSDINGFGMHYSPAFLQANAVALDGLWNEFTDAASHESLLAYVTARATNNWEHILPYICANEYFPDFMSLTSEEVVVDCGAYTGDTLMEYVRRTGGRFRRYYALEPCPPNLEELRGVVTRNNLHDVEILAVGAWDKQERLAFVQDGDQSHAEAVEGEKSSCLIDLDTIDNICGENATFIKMDIEGAELRALSGSMKTIRYNRPKLAVSVYHRTEDLIAIPQFIKRTCPEYRLYFRLHDHLGMGAVLYAL
ncbi:MAG: FkbM family methyltransferase [Verrucomicrobiota bacterium]